MTFQETIKEKLIQCGLAEHEAEKVIEATINDSAFTNNFMHRWNDQTDGYPPMILNLIWLSVKRVALEWIDVNCPQAWFKPLFIGE
jgi:hypothetical protein